MKKLYFILTLILILSSFAHAKTFVETSIGTNIYLKMFKGSEFLNPNVITRLTLTFDTYDDNNKKIRTFKKDMWPSLTTNQKTQMNNIFNSLVSKLKKDEGI